jgi:hypothetical protein
VRDTWNDRDYLVLEAAVRLMDEDEQLVGPNAQAIATDTGLELTEVIRALKTFDNYLLEIRWMMPAMAARVVDASPGARQMVGQWPSAERAADQLIAALEQLAENETDDVKRGKIRQALEAITGAGRDFAIELGAAVVGKAITGG